MTRILSPRIILLGVSAFLAVSLFSTSATQMMNDVIVGTVTSSAGPEAGVWVIAETTDLPTRYIKEVVTDDHGRYLIPDLPKARYTVWARGYGLVDSPKVETEPGKRVDLKPTVAPDREDRRAILSGELLVCPAGGAGGERISRHGRHWKRHFTEHQKPGPVDPPDQDR